jgi:hypothetical protein
LLGDAGQILNQDPVLLGALIRTAAEAQGKLVHSTVPQSISAIVKPLLDSRLSFNEPLTFVSTDGTLKSRQGLTEYETPINSAIICTKTNDYWDVRSENHSMRVLDDESGVPHSKSYFASCWLLNCPLNRFRPWHRGEIKRMSGLDRKWMGHGKPTSCSSVKVLTCFRFLGPLWKRQGANATLRSPVKKLASFSDTPNLTSYSV